MWKCCSRYVESRGDAAQDKMLNVESRGDAAQDEILSLEEMLLKMRC